MLDKKIATLTTAGKTNQQFEKVGKEVKAEQKHPQSTAVLCGASWLNGDAASMLQQFKDHKCLHCGQVFWDDVRLPVSLHNKTAV